MSILGIEDWGLEALLKSVYLDTRLQFTEILEHWSKLQGRKEDWV